MPGGAKPSVSPAVVRSCARELGITEVEVLLEMERLFGCKVEVVEPTEPFMVIVTREKILPTSRSVVCSICETECWAAETYGPLATYLCMECSQNSE